jgi:predicted phage terminase large subunit-like protein
MATNKRLETPLDKRDLELLIEMAAAKARDSFTAFRRFMRPRMLRGWWIDEVDESLQQFYADLVAGRRPKLALMAPPQIGKSLAATDFIAWVAGRNPDAKTIFASYSEDLGVRTNGEVQRMLKDSRYTIAFAGTKIGLPGSQCNANFIEYADRAGSFRNTTVQGAVTGLQLNLGVIDDPVKGRQEVSSRLQRDRTWNWFTDDFLTRCDAGAGLLVVMTRWHVDDLLGRALEKFADFKVLRYPAIAERDEPHRKKGEALFPELKPLDFLLQQKNAMTQGSWEALYQQNPIIVGGGELPIDKLKVLPVALDRGKIMNSVRYWDKGGSEDEDAAYTAGCLMHKMLNGTYVIEHVARGRWLALDREERIKAFAEVDGATCKSYEIWIEAEPGSGGRESAEHTIRNLAGFRVHADRVTGSKRERAQPFAAQVQAGNVSLVAGDWVTAFRDECETWPNGRYKDQIDAAAGAFNRLASGKMFNTNYAQWSY